MIRRSLVESAARSGGIGIAPGVAGSAVDAAVNANNSFQTIFRSGGAPCAGIQPGAPTCPLAVSLNTFPSGTLKTPYYYQYNFGIEQQIGSSGNLRIDFVGTRGLHEPFQVQLNGYQTVCDGCFAPFPYQKPLDQRFGNVNEFRTDANSSYAGLQTAYTQQWRGLTLHGNYTFSHCLDEVSNGGLLAFSTQGLMSPLPGELNRQYASCDYDVRHNISAYGLYQVPFHSSHPFLRQIFGGWSISETAILHSGLPFSVLSQPYIANGNGVFQANGASTVQFNAPAYANRVPGVPVYRQELCRRRHRGRHETMAQPRCVCLGGRSDDRSMCGRRLTSKLPIRQLRTELCPRTALHELRHLHHARRSPSKRASRSVSTLKCSTHSIIPTSRCRARSKPAYLACRFRPDSERLKARSRLLRGCWALGWEATVPRA